MHIPGTETSSVNPNQRDCIKRFNCDTFEIVILGVYYTIPFGLSLIWHFWGITFQLWNYFIWLRITDEDSVPEMRIWSIL